MAFKEIILGSQSPHRQALLRQVEIPFRAVAAKINERQIEKTFKGPINQLAQYLSFEKAMSLKEDFAECIIIGSDQVLIFNNRVLHKPETENEVVDRLKLLQGKSHQLQTGLCVLYKDQIFQETVTTKLTMHSLNENEIKDYTKRDQPLGCAGGYKIEKNGPHLFKSIETPDYFSIIGLPLLSLITILRELNNSRP